MLRDTIDKVYRSIYDTILVFLILKATYVRDGACLLCICSTTFCRFPQMERPQKNGQFDRTITVYFYRSSKQLVHQKK